MNNLLEVLKQGENTHIYTDQDEFLKRLEEIQLSDRTLSLDWDSGAGEEWARFIHKKYGIVYMINTKIGIIFARENYFKQIPSGLFSDFDVVITKNYDKEEWFVDLRKLKEDIPEICWNASDSAVNPDKFSLNDLYFATV